MHVSAHTCRGTFLHEREIGVYWYLFSNHYSLRCIYVAMRVVSAVDDAEVFRFDEIVSNTQIGIEVLLGRIVNTAPQHGDTVREIRSSPNSHMNQLPMCAQDAFFDFLIDFGRTVIFAVSDIGIERRTDAGRRKGVEPH